MSGRLVLVGLAVWLVPSFATGVGLLWAYRRHSRRAAAEPAPAATPAATTTRARPDQEAITRHVRMMAAARTARYGRIDEVQWEAQMKSGASS